MAYLDEICSAVKHVAQSNVRDYAQGKMPKSVARGALDGTMQFPCLVSDTISMDMASTIARSMERVYASFVQSYLSLNSTIDISIDKNPSQFLKRFHKNIRLESTNIDLYKEYCMEEDAEYDELMSRIYDGSTKAYINEKENSLILFNFSESFSATAFESHKALLEESLKAIDFEPFPNVGNSPFFEADNISDQIMQRTVDKAIDSKYNAQAKAHEALTGMSQKDRRIPTITDSDVKKSNDLQPYLMSVRLMAINDQNEFVQFMDFIVGVKVVLHVVKSEEMIANIQRSIDNNGKVFNFIRWTTGEKSLFKDLLLNIEDVKLDVANKSRGASPWFATLKRIKDQSRLQKTFFSRHAMVPQSTIVLSSYDVEGIKKVFGYDIRDPKFGVKAMKSLFLMTLVIVDEGRGTLDILYDNETQYQTYALETIQREIANNAKQLKLDQAVARTAMTAY